MTRHTVSITSSCDESGPIRVAPMAQQPEPDACAALYVGLPLLLPEALRALCSCAGIFYARVMAISSESVQLEVAALSRYFDVDSATSARHVRSLVLTMERFAYLRAHDRQMEYLPTYEQREVVKEHVAQVHWEQQKAVACAAMTKPFCSGDVEASQSEEEREEADLVPLPTMFVPRAVVHQVFCDLHITALRERRVHTALLIAARRTLEEQLDGGGITWQQRQTLKQQRDQIRSIQQWRRQRRDQGYGWQRVVALTEVWDNGRPGWDVIVGMPVAV